MKAFDFLYKIFYLTLLVIIFSCKVVFGFNYKNGSIQTTLDFISTSQIICKGSCTNFSVLSEENILEWSWFFDGADIKTSNVQSPEIICYSKEGMFNVKLIVKYSNGKIDSLVKKHYINVVDTPSVNLGMDLTICSNMSVLLDASVNVDGASYLWNNGLTTPKIKTKSAGLYSVRVDISGCSSMDSIVITHKPAPEVDFGEFEIPCMGDTTSTIELDVSRPNATYLWENGFKKGKRTIKGEGLYWVIVSSKGCETRKKLDLKYKPLPYVELEDSISGCKDQSIFLDAAVPNGTYLWDNGSTNPIKQATSEWNVVEVSSNGCLKKDSSYITFFEPPVINIGDDTVLCDLPIFLSVPKDDKINYEWSNGSIGNETWIKSVGEFWLKSSRNGCSFIDSITVFDCTNSFFVDVKIPNVFSPNGDNINDNFCISNKGIKDIFGTIVTRWGQVIYNWKGVKDKWDGYSISGEILPEGVYFYIFTVVDNKGNTFSYNGSLNLLR